MLFGTGCIFMQYWHQVDMHCTYNISGLINSLSWIHVLSYICCYYIAVAIWRGCMCQAHLHLKQYETRVWLQYLFVTIFKLFSDPFGSGSNYEIILLVSDKSSVSTNVRYGFWFWSVFCITDLRIRICNTKYHWFACTVSYSLYVGSCTVHMWLLFLINSWAQVELCVSSFMAAWSRVFSDGWFKHLRLELKRRNFGKIQSSYRE